MICFKGVGCWESQQKHFALISDVLETKQSFPKDQSADEKRSADGFLSYNSGPETILLMFLIED